MSPHDLHRILALCSRIWILMQTRQFAWGIGVVVTLLFALSLWNSPSGAARWLSFLIVWLAFYGLVALLLTNPVEWLRYAGRQAIGTVLSFLNTFSRIILKVLAAVLGLIYWISPLDFIPDLIPILCWVDDALLFYWLWRKAGKAKVSVPQLGLHDSYRSEPLKMHSLTAVLALLPTALLRIAT